MKIYVLDHGYIELVEAFGRGKDKRHRLDTRRQVPISIDVSEWVSDPDYEIGIIEAARQSTQGSFRGWDQGDDKLLATLFNAEPPHATPFEFPGMTIEVQAPIFVFREWQRHRVQSYNEMSARYAPLPDLYYQPDADDVMARANVGLTTKNKQEAGASNRKTVDQFVIENWLEDVYEVYHRLESMYQQALVAGVPKELARITMPVAHYSRMRAIGKLRNWLDFITLRSQPGVMKETRLYSEALEKLLEHCFPRTMKLYNMKRDTQRALPGTLAAIIKWYEQIPPHIMNGATLKAFEQLKEYVTKGVIT